MTLTYRDLNCITFGHIYYDPDNPTPEQKEKLREFKDETLGWCLELAIHRGDAALEKTVKEIQGEIDKILIKDEG